MRPLPKKIRKALVLRLKELLHMAETDHFKGQVAPTGICYLVLRATCFSDISNSHRLRLRWWLRACFVKMGLHPTYPVEQLLIGESMPFEVLDEMYLAMDRNRWQGSAGIIRRMILIQLINEAERMLAEG